MKRFAPLGVLVFGTSAFVASACGLSATILADPVAADGGVVSDGGPLGTQDGAVPIVATGVFSGQYFSCGLSATRAYCWGSNALGELGTSDLMSRTTPTPVGTSVHFDTLALGENHACGLETATGRVFCWGANAGGQLGLGNTALQLLPQPVMLGTAAKLSVGYVHSCAILTNGALYCWGDNSENQAGQLDDHMNLSVPTRVEMASDWTAVSGGQGHTCGIRKPGTMWCWGRNSDGEIGQGIGAPGRFAAPTRVGTFDDWDSVDLGQANVCGVRRDGTLWCWGDDTANDQNLPKQVGTDTDWTSVSTDVFTTCGIRKGGVLSCFGRNVEGQLGLGDTTDRTTPTVTGAGITWTGVAVGRLHVCAVTSAGEIRCAGKNDDGQLGTGDNDRRNVFSNIAVPSTLPR
jgi:alpha-tubulin suppressor-like RCC1 family protein